MKTIILNLLLYGFAITIPLTPKNSPEMKKITKNNMTVCWEYQNGRIHFEMEAPTEGWVTIGFNSKSKIVGSYLLMGNVIDGKVNVVEHYTVGMGDYRPITDLGANANVGDISGEEKDGKTQIRFSLPITSKTKYGADLNQGRDYILHMAYSGEDSFQHHSVMRTSVEVEL